MLSGRLMVVVPLRVVVSEVVLPRVELPSTVKLPVVSILPVVARVVPETVKDPPMVTASEKSASLDQTLFHLREDEPKE